MSKPASSRAVRHSKSLASIVFTIALFAFVGPSVLVSTTACSGTCSEEQKTSCNNSHSTCVSACGDGTKVGASGLPEPDPNYQNCVKSCNTSLCSCLDECGDDCDESKGNLSGS